MKNSLYYTMVTGKIEYAEFGRIESILPININDTVRYYRIYVTNVVYPDTNDTAEAAMLVLAKSECSVTYRGKSYKFDNLDKLCMAVENERNMDAIEAL